MSKPKDEGAHAPKDYDAIASRMHDTWRNSTNREPIIGELAILNPLEAVIVGDRFLSKLDDRSKQLFLSDLGRVAHESRVGVAQGQKYKAEVEKKAEDHGPHAPREGRLMSDPRPNPPEPTHDPRHPEAPPVRKPYPTVRPDNDPTIVGSELPPEEAKASEVDPKEHGGPTEDPPAVDRDDDDDAPDPGRAGTHGTRAPGGHATRRGAKGKGSHD